MMVDNLVTTGITGYVEGLFYHFLYNPLVDLKFLVPVALLFALTLMLRHRVLGILIVLPEPVVT